MSRVDRVLEVRWFIAGDVPAELQPSARGQQRSDWYQVESLAAANSIKRRGKGGALERKRRVGPINLFERQQVVGYAEEWIKERLGDRASRRRLSGDWVKVEKEVWSMHAVQVGRVVVGEGPWWTIAVALPNGSLTTSGAAMLDQWLPTIAAHGQPNSYPSWLLSVIDAGDGTGGGSERLSCAS